MADKDFLRSLFSDEELVDLFGKVRTEEKKAPVAKTDDTASRLSAYEEWKAAHGGREPDPESTDTSEWLMAMDAESLRKQGLIAPSQDEELEKLFAKVRPEKGITDFSSEAGKLIAQGKARDDRKRAKYTARRMAVKKFGKYRPMFEAVQKELDAKRRRLVPFAVAGFSEGRFYVMDGILCYIDKEYETDRMLNRESDNRLHVVFANGTESFMLFSSFKVLMYGAGGGRTVTEIDESPEDFKLVADSEREKFQRPDVETGCVYVLRTNSEDPEVTRFGKDFYKIGYTTQDVMERIKGCENDPTFLCSSVVPVCTWDCINFKAQGLETLLHRFFSKAQAQVRVNVNGKSVIAKEWYNLPFSVIEEAVPMFISGDIVNYRYDHENRRLVRKRGRSRK